MSRPYVTFCIYHDTNSPEEISKILKLVPSESQTKGSKIRKDKTLEKHFWSVSSRDALSENDDLGDHINWLLGILKSKSQELATLTKAKCEQRIYLFWEVAKFNDGFTIKAPILRELANLKIDLDFDIYSATDD